MNIITMVRIGPDGQPLAEGSTDKHVAVLFPQIGWMLTATVINAEEATQHELAQACTEVDLLGHTDWQLPPIELLKLATDHSRYNPAFNPEFFHDIPIDWLWSSTEAEWSRDSASVAASAWDVNASSGGVSSSHRGGSGFALAARRAGEFQGEWTPVTFQALHSAWKRARRQKVPSRNQMRFDAHWMENLMHLEREIAGGTWRPRRSTSFIATLPKAREIHAPDFADRVVHHWLVPQLERVFERGFIHDSYANRKGKGSHAAVRRAQAFARQVHSGQGGGWYLQLDVHNFFNSIHRPTLWAMLKRRLQRAGASQSVQQVTHALLRHDPLQAGVRLRATPTELAQVPPHKRLANARPGCGLPIGNLSSQFFANVYLDALDQFAKHELKANRYLRYVDDFVLFHHDRAQLEQWQSAIERFLADRLKLSLKPDIRLRRLEDGLDFLGYIIRPTHTLARQRVVAHARASFAQWEGQHVRGDRIVGTPQDLDRIRSVAASYAGHLRHASAYRLQHALSARFPWLRTATRPRRFSHRLAGRRIALRFRRA